MPTAARRSIIAALLVIAGLGVFGLTRLNGSEGGQPLASIVQSVSPADGDKTLHQTKVQADLMSGWDGKLAIDGRDVPADQLAKTQAQQASFQSLSFQPGRGKILEYFPAGQNCVVLTYWSVATGPEQSFTRRWCFTVV